MSDFNLKMSKRSNINFIAFGDSVDVNNSFKLVGCGSESGSYTYINASSPKLQSDLKTAFDNIQGFPFQYEKVNILISKSN